MVLIDHSLCQKKVKATEKIQEQSFCALQKEAQIAVRKRKCAVGDRRPVLWVSSWPCRQTSSTVQSRERNKRETAKENRLDSGLRCAPTFVCLILLLFTAGRISASCNCLRRTQVLSSRAIIDCEWLRAFFARKHLCFFAKVFARAHVKISEIIAGQQALQVAKHFHS